MTDKDSVANAISLVGAGVAMMDVESILTIALLATGIILNIMRIYSKTKD